MEIGGEAFSQELRTMCSGGFGSHLSAAVSVTASWGSQVVSEGLGLQKPELHGTNPQRER